MRLTKKDIINLTIEANRKFYEEFPNEQITEVNEEEEIVMNELYGNVADEILKQLKRL